MERLSQGDLGTAEYFEGQVRAFTTLTYNMMQRWVSASAVNITMQLDRYSILYGTQADLGQGICNGPGSWTESYLYGAQYIRPP